MKKCSHILHLVTLVFYLWHVTAFAHKPSDSYLAIAVENSNINGQWDIALRDLDYAIGLDDDANSEITWQEVLNKQKAITAYAFARLNIQSNQVNCPVTPTQMLIEHHTDGTYAVLKFTAHCKK